MTAMHWFLLCYLAFCVLPWLLLYCHYHQHQCKALLVNKFSLSCLPGSLTVYSISRLRLILYYHCHAQVKSRLTLYYHDCHSLVNSVLP